MTIQFTLHHLFKKLISSTSTIGAVIEERTILTPIRASPVRPDNAYSKSFNKWKWKYWVLQRKYMFKFKITPDRHNGRQNLNYCFLRFFPTPIIFRYHLPLSHFVEIIEQIQNNNLFSSRPELFHWDPHGNSWIIMDPDFVSLFLLVCFCFLFRLWVMLGTPSSEILKNSHYH